MTFQLQKLNMSGLEVFPIIEGGKGISVSNGLTAGSFARAGSIGTFSAVNADDYDLNGNYILQVYDTKITRQQKFEQMVDYAIKGGIHQAKIAYEVASNYGRIHMNMLWEAGGAVRILEGILDKVKGLVHGVTCGAGMPYSLSEMASKYNIYYYPIVSSVRAFKILWKRSYSKCKEWLGGVVYEDPWLAGGHNGISNSEDPNKPEDPYHRVRAIREFMTEIGLNQVPIVLAGGVWHLKDFSHYLNNKEIGLIAFQFGTRPLLTKESPVSEEWKKYIIHANIGDVVLNTFSPTGFYSSAMNNTFLKDLETRSVRQMMVSRTQTEEFSEIIPSGNGITNFYVQKSDLSNALAWINAGYNILMRTPDKTVIFETKVKAEQIKTDQINCMGCLSQCRFSGWKDKDNFSTGKLPDPRSFCIQKTLQDVAHGGSIDNNLVFAGHSIYKFKQDSFYNNGFIPTVKQLVDRIITGK